MIGRTNSLIKQEIINKISYIITTAELPNTIIDLSFNDVIIQTKTTDSITGGKVSFDVNEPGTYTITATNENLENWSNTVVVDNIGEYIVKSGKALANYTTDEMHTALQGGYFSTMFSLKDTFTLVKSGNILNNHKFFVENITAIDGKEIVDFRMADKYSGGQYNINPQYAYLSSASSTSWSYSYSGYGGYKYSVMRQRMMEMGESVYMQAQSIKPDDSTVEGGIPFSQMKYTDNNNVSAIYSYNAATDTMTALTSWQPITNREEYFVKGYFKNVGTIDESTFNSGNYYTYNTSTYVYTPATTYASGTTYYGFYETLQEDGIFADALKSSDFGSYLVKFNDMAGAGKAYQDYINSFNDYGDIPATEEITGININTILLSGKLGVNIDAHNVEGESIKKPAYDKFSIQATGNTYWNRSPDRSLPYQFCRISMNGNMSVNAVYISDGVRLGFRLS